jgi:hypothetical protein
VRMHACWSTMQPLEGETDICCNMDRTGGHYVK